MKTSKRLIYPIPISYFQIRRLKQFVNMNNRPSKTWQGAHKYWKLYYFQISHIFAPPIQYLRTSHPISPQYLHSPRIKSQFSDTLQLLSIYNYFMQDSPLLLEEQPQTTCFKKIKLNSGISTKNFIGCLSHYFMLSFVFVSIDSLQPMLLQQKFKIDRQHSIDSYLNSLVIAFDIITKVVTAPLFGYLADKYGRKIVNTYGIIVIAISMFVMPFCNEFYQYCLARVFYAQGAIAISVVPFLGDYIHNDSKGTSSAILVFMSSLGALASAEINFNILKNTIKDHIYIQYLTAGSVTIVVGLLYSLICLKPGNSYYVNDQPKEPRSFAKMVQIGRESFKSPEITLSYLSAFLARSDSILLSLFMVLWTVSFMPGRYNEAYSISSMLSGITYAVIMLSCIVYGLLLQRKKSTKFLLCGMLGMAAVGTLMINLVNSLSSFLVYASLVILGLGMSGLLTSSLYLVNTYAPPQDRAYITSIQTLFGIIGITVQTFIGSVLFHETGRNGPFNLFGGICVIMIVITLIVFTKKRSLDTKRDADSLIESGQSM